MVLIFAIFFFMHAVDAAMIFFDAFFSFSHGRMA